MKLRHSRKFWFFANALAIARLATEVMAGEERFKDELTKRFDVPPALRLIQAAGEEHAARVAVILERYSFFLNFMSRYENRQALATIAHEDRYGDGMNPYMGLKLNSDALHTEMMALLMELDGKTRQNVLDWFLL